jgi:YtcA-like protein
MEPPATSAMRSTLAPTAGRSVAIAGPCTALAARWANGSIGGILSIASRARVVPSARSLRILAALAPLMLGVGGCAPSLPLFGAYFPSWLLCAVIGISGALAIRVVLVRVGIDDALPLRPLVYVSLASAIACSVALLGRIAPSGMLPNHDNCLA